MKKQIKRLVAVVLMAVMCLMALTGCYVNEAVGANEVGIQIDGALLKK